MAGARPSLSLIIPAYNEASRMLPPLSSAISFLESHFDSWEIIYSNDGSSDKTAELVLEVQKKRPSVRLVDNPVNLGKGAAVRAGFEAAKGDIVMFSDADFSSPPEETLKLLAAIDEGFDLAIGSRGLEDSQIEIRQSWPRETMGKIFNLILRAILPIPFRDTQCGFKMFRKEAAQMISRRMRVRGFAFDVEMLMIAQKHNLKIKEVPVVWRNVLESKVHPFRSSLDMLMDVLAIRYRMFRKDYD